MPWGYTGGSLSSGRKSAPGEGVRAGESVRTWPLSVVLTASEAGQWLAWLERNCRGRTLPGISHFCKPHGGRNRVEKGEPPPGDNVLSFHGIMGSHRTCIGAAEPRDH